MFARAVITGLFLLIVQSAVSAEQLQRLEYNNPGLVTDLGVGLWGWPLPMDYDGDGDLDLLVSCSDTPYRGMYFFENPGGDQPIFKPAVRIGYGIGNIGVSYVDGKPHVLIAGAELPQFLKGDFDTRNKFEVNKPEVGNGRIRANQWSYVDYDGDGDHDLIIGIGYWGDYGWDNAFNEKGEWTRGPLHGYVFLLTNTGNDQNPAYSDPQQLQAQGAPIDVYGMPSPNFADFDGDGDLDLLCGDFIDGFTYFQNTGSRTKPVYAAGRELARDGKTINMPLCMIVVSAIDWDHDGDVDLVVGQEDGRVALLEHTGKIDNGMPVFNDPVFFQQQAQYVKFGALVTPVGFDWDDDGDEDLVCGNTAGEIGWIENLNDAELPAGQTPRWAAPELIEADGTPIRIMAGPNGSIQGPAETKWGYTTICVADWNMDGLPDIIANSIWGKVIWYQNIGSRTQPQFADAQPITVQWQGTPPKPAWNWWNPKDNELATEWRTTPLVTDFNGDGLSDLIMLDHEGYLCLFTRTKVGDQLQLLPGQRIFQQLNFGPPDQRHIEPLRLNSKSAGGSGRRKLCLTDLDGDGRIDLIVNSTNANFLRNVTEPEDGGLVVFQDLGPLSDHRLAGHTTSPTTVDWNRDGVPEVVIGAEDGHFYYLPDARAKALAMIKDAEQKQKEIKSVTLGNLSIMGSHFELATLKVGSLAYSNRQYTWLTVPAPFAGWQYTQTGGGETSQIAVTPRTDTTIYFATVSRQKGINTSGWTQLEQDDFVYSDAGKTTMQVYKKSVKAGEMVTIPQGNWSGGLLLIPPPGAALP